MTRQKASSRNSESHLKSQVIEFLSRADLLHRRGRRNYNRYMLVTKKLVAPDGPERLRWQRESAEESQHDVAWNRHHGPVPGGATILLWRDEDENSAQASTSALRLSV
jgi:hypothetical protein